MKRKLINCKCPNCGLEHIEEVPDSNPRYNARCVNCGKRFEHKEHKNMKEFNLELAKAGHPVQTRDGRPVRIICYDRKDGCYPIVALVNNGNYETTRYYNNNGINKEEIPEDAEIFMSSITKEGWINLYRSSIYVAGVSNVYETEEEALKCSTEKGYILTKKIEWEE